MGTKKNSVKTHLWLTRSRLKRLNRAAAIVWIALTIGAGALYMQYDRSQGIDVSRLEYSIFISTALAGDDDDAAEKAREREDKAREREEKRRKKELKRARKEEKKRLKAEEKRRKEERKEAEKRREKDRKKAEKRRKQERKDAEKRREQDRKNAEKRRESDDDDERERADNRDDDDNDRSSSDDGDNNRNSSDDDDNNRNAGNGSDDDDDKDGNRQAKKNLDDDENVRPPATVVEMIKRLVKPKRKKRKFGRGFSLGGPTFTQNEVLAANLSTRSIRRAQRLGFKVKKGANLSSLDLKITRLIAPRGMGARRARVLLHRDMPHNSFTLNKLYRIHPASRSARRGKSARRPQLQRKFKRNRKCRGDRCYATSVMKWRPQLRSCARNVKIGLIDTPIDHEHPAFRGRRVQTGKFIPPGRKAASKWHGTGVLALLSGNSNTSTPGLIPGSEFFVANAFFADASGTPVADSVSMLNALDWMDRFNVNVVNLSVAGPKDPLVEKAIAQLSKKGMIFVAAAGNNGPSAPPSYPAAYRQVIAVTAVNKKLSGYRYANRGSYIDVAAPGVDIWTAIPERREGYQSGTSFAVPYVTAVIAAMYDKTTHRTKEQLLNRLKTRDLGNPGRDKIYGRGLVIAPKRCRPEPAWQYSISRASTSGRR